MRIRIAFLSAVIVLLAAAAYPADVKYTQEMSAGQSAGPAGQMPAMRFTVYVKGKQERRDMNMEAMGMNISTITNCEKTQTITINSKCKLYLVSPMDPEGGSTPSMGGRGMPERKGGLVVVENEFRDTGEHKTMLGRDARHVVMKMKMDAGEGACQPGHTEVENDLWMVDVDAHLACQPKSWERPQQQGGACRDRFQVKTKGTESMSRGLPVLSKFTTHSPSGQPQSFTMEVKELTVGPLESSLFEIPAGFKEAKSQQELYMCSMGGPMGGAPAGNDRMAAAMEAARTARKNAETEAGEAMEKARTSGGLRIGVGLSGSAGASSSAELAEQLAGDIKGMDGFDAVRINARAPAEAQQEAVQKKCDLLLYADLAETKQSTGSRIGGILGRAARGDVANAAANKHNVRLDYRLTVAAAPGDEVSRDTMNNSFTDEDGPFAMLQQTADRAAADARRWKKKKN